MQALGLEKYLSTFEKEVLFHQASELANVIAGD